jgi:hypothetical protein
MSFIVTADFSAASGQLFPSAGFQVSCQVLPRSECLMITTEEKELVRPGADRGAESPGDLFSLDENVEGAVAVKRELDRLRNWREFVSPKIRRIATAGQLLFQLVGFAGFIGYFAGMHTFMRVLSGVLMASAWYAIYRVRRSA